MRTLNDVKIAGLAFAALQTGDASGGITVSHDDGVLKTLLINVTSGTMTAPNTFDVVVNGVTTVEVFRIPVTAANVSAVADAEKQIAIKAGDRVQVLTGGDTGGTVPALGSLILRR
tara:strand:- start:1643 stop:1990 length:348 start_codon:yes stop_codon:yes gene_type:complete